jgi:glycosyltransferase involved in cell wall biosynthesis
MHINHVLGTDQRSRIFDDLIYSYKTYGNLDHEVSVDPAKNADIYIHHRINRSEWIPKNSIAFIHHDLSDIDPAFSYGNYMNKIRSVKGIICLNSCQKIILKAEHLISDFVIIPHGYRCSEDILTLFDEIIEYKNSHKINMSTKVNLFINSRRYRRGVKGDSLMRRLFQDLDPDRFRWTLCGEDRLIDSISCQNFGFENDLKLTKNYPETIRLYREADLLLNLSWYEGGPANLPEALSTATPVISQRIGMALDLFESDYLGFFNSYRELLSILKNWETNKLFRQNLQEQTLAAASKLKSQKDVAIAIEDFAQGILNV